MYRPSEIALLRSGWKVNTRPYELNIVGLRSPSVRANKFDDTIYVFYYDAKGRVVEYNFPCTTDAGTFWLENPYTPKGTAILQQGQYAYQIGLHQGRYKALVQKGQVNIRRDYDRNAILDFYNGTLYTGYFGINIHHAKDVGTTKVVDRWSAGCQVFANIQDYNFFMSLCEKHRQLYGNHFLYGLIDMRAQQRTLARRTLYAGVALSAFVYRKEIINYINAA
ncbi:hypothetical protein [Bernardetia sp.]|uniref:hypothetical protein n=1 Tax=Bernardetia sp. TaxID=1937974 RepID=UPI0025C5EE91|nr:hypothetical protein [Bernardetia sp.]